MAKDNHPFSNVATITADDIIQNPNLLLTSKLTFQHYPELLKSNDFKLRYIERCAERRDLIDKLILEHIDFSDVYFILAEKARCLSDDSEAVISLLVFYCASDLFENDVKPLLMKHLDYDRDVLKSYLGIVFKRSVRAREKMLKDPNWLLKLFSHKELIRNLIDTFSDIPDKILHDCYSECLINIKQINLRKMRQYNPEKCNLFFPYILKEATIILNPHEVIHDFQGGDVFVYDENDSHLNAFTLKDLSTEHAFLLYLEYKKYGLKSMVWVAQVNRLTRYRQVDKKALEELKTELDVKLSTAIGQDINAWMDIQRTFSEALHTTMDQHCNFYIKVFQEEIQKYSPTVEIDVHI